tara:strand:- start:125 stop:757 length:633 start_codon:yes stop_codon:yes gene_type:complete
VKDSDRLVCTLILAGGLSKRMGGVIKTFLKFNDKTILDRIIDKTNNQNKNILINANSDNFKISNKNYQIIKDVIEGFKGPLAGIHSGFDWIHKNKLDYKWLVTVPSDTPFLPNNLIEELFDKILSTKCKIVLASHKNKIHPVIGIWDCSLKEDLEKNLKKGVRKIMNWVVNHEFEHINFENEKYDPFFNINTKQDLLSAKEIEDKLIKKI